MTSSSTLLARALSTVAMIALVSFGGHVQAASTWSLSGGDCGATASGTNLGTSEACTGGLTISGWSTGSAADATPTMAGTTYGTANIYNWGTTTGLGILANNETNTTGPHAMDNIYGTDAMLLNFSAGPVNLTGLTIGWNGTDNGSGTAYNDSDMSVLAWTGSGAPPTLSGSASNLLSAGWTLIGNYANVGSNTNNAQAPLQSSGAAIYSSYWLVSTYNDAYSAGGCVASSAGGTCGGGNDAFKLVSVDGTVKQKVPEPGSLALMALGLVGMGTLRRRQYARKGTAN